MARGAILIFTGAMDYWPNVDAVTWFADSAFEAVRAVAEEVRESAVCGLARTHADDIERAHRALEAAARPRIHTFIATSDIHLQAKFADARYGTTLSEKRKSILRMASDAVALARDLRLGGLAVGLVGPLVVVAWVVAVSALR